MPLLSANGGAGGASLATALVCLVAVAMSLDALGAGYAALLENKGPILLVALGLLVAFYSSLNDTGAATAGQLVPGRRGNSTRQQQQQEEQPGPGPSRSGQQLAAAGPSRGGGGQQPALGHSLSGTVISASSSTAVAALSGQPSGGGSGGSSTALVPAEDRSSVLIESEWEQQSARCCNAMCCI